MTIQTLWYIVHVYYYINKYGCLFLKLHGESILDLIPILFGSLPLAHNAQYSLVSIRRIGMKPAPVYVIGRAGASPPSRIYRYPCRTSVP